MLTELNPLTTSVIVLSVDLYASGRTIDYDNGEGELLRSIRQYPEQNGDRYHTVTEGDSLLGIAYTYYSARVANAQYLWHIIADANMVFDPFDLSEYVGYQLRVPNIDGYNFSENV